MSSQETYWTWWRDHEKLKRGHRPSTRLERLNRQLAKLTAHELRAQAAHTEAVSKREHLEQKIAKVVAILRAGDEESS